MIEKTYTYITFWSENEAKKSAIDSLKTQLSDFTETQTNVNIEDFLIRFLEKNHY